VPVIIKHILPVKQYLVFQKLAIPRVVSSQRHELIISSFEKSSVMRSLQLIIVCYCNLVSGRILTAFGL